MKRYTKTRFAVAFAAILGLASCGLDIDEMKEGNPDSGTALKLTADTEEPIVLNERQSEETALALTWTTGSNYGTGNAIEYIIEMDKADGDWSGSYSENLGKRVYSRNYTVEELNTILRESLGAVPGTEASYKARLTASVIDRQDLMQTSEIAFKATTYQPVADVLYMMTGNGNDGWNADEAIEMTRSSAGIFTYEAILDDCEFRFITSRGNEWPAYIRSGDGSDGQFNAVYSASAPAETDDINFSLSGKSFYRITVNLFDLTVTVEDILTETLYLIGDATPGGWSLDNLTPMEMTGKGTFTWTGTLTTAGEGFKFVTTANFWPGYVKANNDADDWSLEYFGADPGSTEDLKFKVPEPGEYQVDVDLLALTVKVSKTGEAEFNTLYMIGDATEGGWDNNKATEMTMVSEGKYTWTGTLKASPFRFIVSLGSFAPGYWKAKDDPDDMSIVYSETGLSGADDRSFQIAEEGIYTVTADTEGLMVSIVKQTEEDPYTQTLYIFGSSTPGGWDINSITAMERTGAGQFTWTGQLKAAGDSDGFCFLPTTDWWPRYVRDGEAADGLTLKYFESDPQDASLDLKFTVAEDGEYTVNVNLATNRVSYEKTGEADQYTQTLYMIGDSTPGGWSIDLATELTRTGSGQFTWTGHLTKAEEGFKFITRKDWWPGYVRDGEAADGLTLKYFESDPGGGYDLKFPVDEEGEYNMTVDLRTLKISYSKQQ